MDGAHLGAPQVLAAAPRGRRCRSAITSLGQAGRRRGHLPLHRDARRASDTPPHLGRGGRAAGIAVSLYGVRSARNWGCGDFRDLLEVVDWAAEELRRQLRRPQPAARHPQPPAVQHQPLSAQLHLLPELSSTWTWRAWRISRAAAAPGGCAARRPWPPKSTPCASAPLWNTSAWPRSSCAS